MDPETEKSSSDLLEAGKVADNRTVDEVSKDELKMWLLVRMDTGISAAKLAAQSGHAFFSLGAQLIKSEAHDLFNEYAQCGQAKIVVGVKDSSHLLSCVASADAAGIGTMCVEDAGRTELEPGTLTVAAIGPCRKSELPGKIKRLRLYSHKNGTDE